MATATAPPEGGSPKEAGPVTELVVASPPQSRWTIRQIECFVALAETLHFGRAAAKLHMTQPAFSRQIKSLEEALGLHLVERDSQSVNLTLAGEALLVGSGEALTSMQNAIVRARLFQQGLAGSLRIGYTDFAISSVLPDILCAFKQDFPEIALEPAQGATRDLLNDLHERRLDIAFVTGPVAKDGLETVLVSSNKLLAVLYESHPLAKKQTITLADLADEDFVFGSPKLWRYFLRHIDQVFDAAQIRPNVVETAFNSEGLFGLVAGKLGVTLYPDCVLNYYRRGLVIRSVSGLDAAIPTIAVWQQQSQSRALEHFRAVLANCLDRSQRG